MHQRPTSMPHRRRGRRERITQFCCIHAFVRAATLSLAVGGSTGPLSATELELVKPLVNAAAAKVVSSPFDDEAVAPTEIAQRTTSLLGPSQPAEFDIELDSEVAADEFVSSLNGLDGKSTKTTQSAVASNHSFSDAFTNALKHIQERDASQRPTPARDGSTPLSTLLSAVEDDVARGSKRGLNVASEVQAAPAKDVPSSHAQSPTPEAIEPSVAGPIGNTGKAKPAKPLDVELEKYFDGLDTKTTPDTPSVARVQKAAAPRIEDANVPGNEAASKKALEEALEEAPINDAPTATVRTLPAQVQAPPRRNPPREPNVRITRRMASLQPKVAKTLQFYFDRPLNTRDDSAWSVMHSMLGYGPNGQVAINSDRGLRTNVVNWLCQNGVCANRQMLYIQDGYIRGLEGPGFQGHPGQFLAMLAQIGTKRDYPMNIQGERLNVEALINSEMYTCSSQKELTFKLISLSYYLDSDASWKSETGETWNLPKILSMEMSQPVNGAACGGTHRIMSISCAVRNRWLRGEPIDGVYAQAQQYVRQYQQYALSLQNRDGSFSSEWFKRRAESQDKDRQLQTSGHILEWLVYTLPRNELSDSRIVSGVEFLTDLMSRHRYRDWEVGPRGHAIRALSLYHQRVFERQPSTPQMANAALWSSVLR